MCVPRKLLAMAWPQSAFTSETAAGALQALFGADPVAASDQITLKAPEIAENGAVVPVTVESTLPNARSISLVVEKNPRPLAVMFELSPRVPPNVSCRIKMGQTSNVIAVVQTDAGLFSTSKEVKVTIGGCGG
jgi:sulfur-oxidizing protein SoxY